MELSEYELLDFTPKTQLKRIKILKTILGIENIDIDISENELHNIIEHIFKS